MQGTAPHPYVLHALCTHPRLPPATGIPTSAPQCPCPPPATGTPNQGPSVQAGCRPHAGCSSSGSMVHACPLGVKL